MAAGFVDVLELEIDQFKENAVPPLLQVTQFTENWYVCLHFLLQSFDNF